MLTGLDPILMPRHDGDLPTSVRGDIERPLQRVEVDAVAMESATCKEEISFINREEGTGDLRCVRSGGYRGCCSAHLSTSRNPMKRFHAGCS
jgi:hypothetical protein